MPAKAISSATYPTNLHVHGSPFGKVYEQSVVLAADSTLLGFSASDIIGVTEGLLLGFPIRAQEASKA